MSSEATRARRRARYAKKRVEERIKKRAYYAAHKEEMTAKRRVREAIPENRARKRIRQSEYQKKYPEKQSANMYGAIYPEGVTKAFLRQKQEDRCASCKHPPRPKDGLVTDHDHGLPNRPNVRGLLHLSCNAAAGTLGDTWEGVQQMADYLKAWEQPFDTVWDHP